MAREVDVGKGSEVVEGEVVDRFEGECRSLSAAPCVLLRFKGLEGGGMAGQG